MRTRKYTRRPCYRHVPTCGFTSSQAGARVGPAVGTHGVWDWGSWDALPRCRHHLSASRAGVSFAGIGGGHLAGFLPRSSLPVGGHLRGCPRPPPVSWAAGDTQRGGRRPADAAEVSAPPAHLCSSERCAHSPPGSLRAWPRGALLAGHEDELSRPTRAAPSPPGASGPLSQPHPCHLQSLVSLPLREQMPPYPREAGRAWLPDQGRLGAAATLWVPGAQGRQPREAQADADACEQARDTVASGSGQLGQKLRALSRHGVPGNGSWQKSMSSEIAHPIIPLNCTEKASKYCML